MTAPALDRRAARTLPDIDQLTIYRHYADRSVYSVVGAGVTGTLRKCRGWCKRWYPNVPIVMENDDD